MDGLTRTARAPQRLQESLYLRDLVSIRETNYIGFFFETEYRLSITHPKCLELACLDFEFGGVWNICMCMRYFRDETQIYIRDSLFSCIPYIHRLKITSHSILTVVHRRKSGVQFSTCIRSALKTLQILKDSRFCCFGLRMFNL